MNSLLCFRRIGNEFGCPVKLEAGKGESTLTKSDYNYRAPCHKDLCNIFLGEVPSNARSDLRGRSCPLGVTLLDLP